MSCHNVFFFCRNNFFSPLKNIFTESQSANTDLTLEKVLFWKKYIEFQEKNAKPQQVVITFERAVLTVPTSVDLWDSFCFFAFNTLSNVSKTNLEVCERAVRNCYWSGTLWSRRILTMEKFSIPKPQIEGDTNTNRFFEKFCKKNNPNNQKQKKRNIREKFGFGIGIF